MSENEKANHVHVVTKATCTFVVEDVLDVFDITEDEAEEWLRKNRRRIEDRMCERGWEVIETLGCMDGFSQKGE